MDFTSTFNMGITILKAIFPDIFYRIILAGCRSLPGKCRIHSIQTKRVAEQWKESLTGLRLVAKLFHSFITEYIHVLARSQSRLSVRSEYPVSVAISL